MSEFVSNSGMALRNITITMEESVAEWVRMEAARRDTSVSRLVGELLAEKMRHDDAYARAMADWQQRQRRWKGAATPTRAKRQRGSGE
ncbi:hypothetical protein HNQ51_001940 [Inhella inkyongensis]|uniref:CopG family transcriptional regulator n=1 Tax=Inhella inkyongensis TaxID=392593 RepID=A0A840S6K7_9BURK|nr:CopG family transcriptional regulator [Inhella inkyongensis]MBB5204626.1 hypothetical protein [Inhella inkyongensis]